jgi:hypothetical protein
VEAEQERGRFGLLTIAKIVNVSVVARQGPNTYVCLLY